MSKLDSIEIGDVVYHPRYGFQTHGTVTRRTSCAPGVPDDVIVQWKGTLESTMEAPAELKLIRKAFVEKRSVVQDWVSALPGLRHQGVLLTAVRGCDVSPKEDPSKALTRCFRAVVLNAHVGDPKKALTFIEDPGYEEVARRMIAVTKDYDSLPIHYVMHLVHAAEIVGYHHPDAQVRELWIGFYAEMVRKLHLRVESKEELRERLCADEERFWANQ